MVLETPSSFLERQPANDAQTLRLMAFDENSFIKENQNQTAGLSPLSAFLFSFDSLV